MRHLPVMIGLFVLTSASSTIAQTPPKGVATTEANKFYTEQVQPILKASCIGCHGVSSPVSGGLSLAVRGSLLKGGVSGPAINLSNPDQSLLLRAINYQGKQMPPDGKLPKSQIDVLTRWVNMGAPMPVAAPASRFTNEVNAQTMKFWSFQPVKRPAVPVVKNHAVVASPIDAFIHKKLEANHLTLSGRAAKTALLRRATYDLTGLPPTPAELKAFLSDTSPRAYAKVVDRLLASPHYGERWARHWLDLVRYAESNSFERDNPKPFAWRYRDYVIRAFNQDKPYDRFIKEQLAGDEINDATDESLIATGYYRLGAWDDEPSDPEQARYDELDDIVATTGQVFLGLTVNCARCHEHKIDPIPQKDYYRLVALFQGITRYGGSGRSVEQNSLRPLGTEAEKQRYAREEADYRQQIQQADKRLREIERKIQNDLMPVEKEEFGNPEARLAMLKKRVGTLVTDAEYQEAVQLRTRRKELDQHPPKGLEQALCVTELGKTPPPTHLLLRGNPHVPADEVEPGFLTILNPPKPVIPSLPDAVNSSGRRLALANWIASPSNQLTARVIVNRVWQHHFGRGIVRTPSNFGLLGTAPTHPELLDWLASELVRNGWKLKPLHRLIMLSNAYCQSSRGNATALAKDPENNLFWRFDMRRLDAEEIRDSILAVNGALNTQMWGPPIYPTIPAEVLAGESRPGANWEKSTPEEQARRSIYIHIKRSLTVPILASFDVADTDFTCPVRFATTQPTQALGMLNSKFANDQASVLSTYAARQAGADPRSQVKLILERVMQRAPSVAEIDRGVNFIHKLMQRDHLDAKSALTYFCVVALNLNEFIYLD